jgi:trehalose 6-phosphate synthase
MKQRVLVASNRGPISYQFDADGSLTGKRGGGGMIAGVTSGLAAVGPDAEVTWICAALSDADRAVARQQDAGTLDQGHQVDTPVRMLDIPPDTFDRAYNNVANSTLWFVHHLLFDTPNQPQFGRQFRRDWESYLAYNEAFADALAEDALAGQALADEGPAVGAEREQAPSGVCVLVQDYHLSLAPRLLRDRLGEASRDIGIAHFSHTPWAPPDYYRMLPVEVGRTLLDGILGADHVGFHAGRWAAAFLDCCEAILGADVDRAGQEDPGPGTAGPGTAGPGTAGPGRTDPGRTDPGRTDPGRTDPGRTGPGGTDPGSSGTAGRVTYRGHVTQVAVHPLGVDAPALRARAREQDVRAHVGRLSRVAGGRKLIVRVDRTELSKNIVRGLAAYRELLATRPQWRGRVVHLALAYPSRSAVPEYRAYTDRVMRLAREITEEFGTADWNPLILEVKDDYPRSLAACALADVLLVNPIRDGMNLVAQEGPVLSERGCALVLSREAGAAATLADDALLVNPFDVSETAEALHQALAMPDAERRRRSAALAATAAAAPPARWLGDQLASLRT